MQTEKTEIRAEQASGERVGFLLGGLLLLFAGGLVLGLLWCMVGAASLAWLAWQTPLTVEDLAQTSWLGSPITALHFSTGPVAWFMGAGMALSGLILGFAKRSPIPPVVCALMIATVALVGSKASAVRIGILDGTIKIGCFVETSKECLELLGLPAGDSKSRYNADQSDAAWYVAAREAIVTPEQKSRTIAYVMPGWLFRAPLYIGAASELRSRIETQRSAVAALVSQKSK